MAKIAFIGLGNMGSGMAINLVRAGHEVMGFDLNESVLERAVNAGCKKANSVLEAIKHAEVVITMLPAGQHVRSVYLGKDGIIANAKSGTIMIDSSTIDVESAREVISMANEHGHFMVDAPVSGGVTAAKSGNLTFMVGGSKSAFAKASPYLEAMGTKLFHAGEAGNGQVAKVCNNMLLGIVMIGTCEAFTLAEKLGLDAETFYNISSNSSGQSWSMTAYCPAPGPVPSSPANRDYAAGFTAAMMLKDLRLAANAANAAKAATPLGGMAESLYALIEQAGKDDIDFSGIMKLINGTL